jgi:hypothetical protein
MADNSMLADQKSTPAILSRSYTGPTRVNSRYRAEDPGPCSSFHGLKECGFFPIGLS